MWDGTCLVGCAWDSLTCVEMRLTEKAEHGRDTAVQERNVRLGLVGFSFFTVHCVE